MKAETAIRQIEIIRAKNNKLWMGYVRLAYKHAPKEAARLHKQIRVYDRQITRLGRKLDRQRASL